MKTRGLMIRRYFHHSPICTYGCDTGSQIRFTGNLAHQKLANAFLAHLPEAGDFIGARKDRTGIFGSKEPAETLNFLQRFEN